MFDRNFLKYLDSSQFTYIFKKYQVCFAPYKNNLTGLTYKIKYSTFKIPY